ncbi:MAG TPA: 16S rRNA (cytidine(1402)-2'-O)-methyltransferase [Alphaproteobacteria bacterium]|nr:16S rRNA (cytidine(1402)-2'-O)-methyltransferase [Alphaproteobacteria bacterium]
MSEQTFIKGLYLVATPIGNLGDISARAVEVLKKADLIACEDTRVTAKLLSYLGISAKLTPYHEHNAEKVRPQLMERLKNGEMIAQVSDAGTPIVSDPGYRLVQDCIANGIYFTAIPGASAVLTALQLSGLPSHRWLFEGFLPPKTAAKEKELKELSAVPATLIFYESPNRLIETLEAMKKVLGDRCAAVARELTKKFEQTVRGTFSELLTYYERNGQPKGEIVIVVAPPSEQKADAADIDALLKKALETMRVKDAAAVVAEQTGVSKKELYRRALELK